MYKSILLLISFLFISTHNLKAQETYKPMFGLDLSLTSLEEASDPGYSLGIFVEQKFKSNFAFTSALRYYTFSDNMTGGEYSYNMYTEVDLIYKYIQIPLGIKFYSNIVNIHSGLAYNINLDHKIDKMTINGVDVTDAIESYSVYDDNFLSFYTTISHEFELEEEFFMEPSFGVNLDFEGNFNIMSLTIAVKKTF